MLSTTHNNLLMTAKANEEGQFGDLNRVKNTEFLTPNGEQVAEIS